MSTAPKSNGKINPGTWVIIIVLSVMFAVIVRLADGGDPTEQQLRDDNYVSCSNWAGNLGTSADAECIDDDGSLTEFGDTPYDYAN